MLLFTTGVILLFCACRKEVTVTKEVPVVHSWLLDSSLFGPDKILLTSAVLNDSVLGVANNALIWYVNANRLNKSINGAVINFTPNYGYLLSPSISSTVGATLVDSNHLRVFSTSSPVDNFQTFTFTPSYTNATYSVKGFPLPAFLQKSYPIVNNTYILAPTEMDYTNQKAYCSLLRVSYTPGFPALLTLGSAKAITLTPGPMTIGFGNGDYYSASYFGKFFLAYNSQFYRIDTLGNVKAFGYCPVPGEVNGRVGGMFTLDNYLFAVGVSKFFVSSDKGETWSVFFDAGIGSSYTSLSYLNIGNEVYATSHAQIWRVTLSGSTLKYQELDTDGLETNQITSVNKAGKYAFVTTLAGLYYRDTARLNTPHK